MEHKCKNIILLGKTGSGKSTVGNVLSAKKEFEESPNLDSCTKNCKIVENHLFGNPNFPKVKIIDTPGFMDSTGQDNNTVDAIMEMLETVSEEGIHLGIFCFAATETRCDGGIVQALTLIHQLMSREVFQHMVLCITQVNKLRDEFGSA
jgi:predicted GTPase